jgi:hypothetical protein
MFEDFRKQTEDASFQDEDQTEESPVENPFPEPRHFLGMTPVQRFIVVLMLLMMTIILGFLFLLVTAKIAPPFLS